MISKNTSETIDFLRFPLALGVVFIHFEITKDTGFYFNGINHGLDCSYWFFKFTTLISAVIAHIAVPLFFMISGFCFFNNKSFTLKTYRDKLAKRTQTLLIPYLIWNVIAVLILIIKSLPPVNDLFHTEVVLSGDYSIQSILNIFWDSTRSIIQAVPISSGEVYPMDEPLWFIRELMVVVSLSPIIYLTIKYTKGIAVLGYGAFSFIIKSGYLNELATALMMFSLGAYFAIYGIDFVKLFRKFKFAIWIYLPLAVIDALTKGAPINRYFKDICVIVGIVAAVQLSSILLEKGKVHVNKFLASGSFLLFALHDLIMHDLANGIYTLCGKPESTLFFVVFYIAIPLATAAICYLLYLTISKNSPTLTKLLTGGR